MLSHHQPYLADAAQTAVQAVVHIGTVEMPGAFAVIAVTWMFRQILGVLGRNYLSRLTWWDDVVRLILGFIGYVGPLSTIPLISGIASAFTNAIDAGAQNAGVHTVLFLGLGFVSIAIAILGGRHYYRNDSSRGFIIFALCSMVLLNLPWFQDVTTWYIIHIGMPTWDFLLGVWNNLQQPITL